jgi:hypothetical protein
MLRKPNSLFVISMGIIFLVLITAPYLWGYLNAGREYAFGGFLLNPIDGNSYLAKMYQGWQGRWRFTLPYTAQASRGVFLFMYYLILGHLNKLIGGSLQATFHVARLAGSILLLLSLWNFFGKVMPSRRSARIAYAIAIFGSGFGWAAAAFGLFTSDFWVAEGYPFLSAYANPHFPLGMAILIWVLTPLTNGDFQRGRISGYGSDLLIVMASFILGIILPFGLIIAGIVLGGLIVLDIWVRLVPVSGTPWQAASSINKLWRFGALRKLIALVIGGIPVLLYEVWITRSDPLLANWNAQNYTISPPLWDLAISLGFALILAVPGAWLTWKSGNSPARILVLWSVIGLLMLYMPLGLQRRFMIGVFIPLAGLAGIGLDFLLPKRKAFALVVVSLVVIMVVPTNLMIILGGIQAINAQEPDIYLKAEEKLGLDWIAANTPQDSLVLAGPELGLYIPAYTGRLVIYGHPFETVNAKQMESIVINYFEGSSGEELRTALSDVDYVFYGPREKSIGKMASGQEMNEVFSAQDVQIFEVDSQPATISEKSMEFLTQVESIR